MNPGRLAAVFLKELLQVRRDPHSLIQIILLPVMMLLLYGYALTFDVRLVPFTVYDLDGGAKVHDFISHFSGSPFFSPRPRVADYQALDRLVSTREVRLGLVVPQDFSRDLLRGRSTRLQAIVDGTEPNTANLVLGYTQGVLGEFNWQLLQERLHRQGLTGVELPLRPEPRFWFNADLEGVNYIVPGLVVSIMALVGTLLTTLTVVRELERGTMESLMATGLTKAELLLGKLGTYFLIGMVDMLIFMAMAKFLFEVPLRGSLSLLIGVFAIYLLIMLAQGLFISMTADNQFQAYQVSMLITFVPAVMLSGFVFAIPLMPWWLQALSYLVPARYMVSISKGIYLKGVGIEVLGPDILMLVGYAAVLGVVVMLTPLRKIR
jgi:ABC-2 type transport system permease protein